MGWADVGIMGFRENLDACRHLVSCTGMALFGDADTGYGNAVNVFFTVRGYEDAGLAGVMIEDQVWPKSCGHMKGKEVISLRGGHGKDPRRRRGPPRSRLRHQVAHRHAGHAWHRRGDQAPQQLCRGGRRPVVRRCAAERRRYRDGCEECAEAVVRQHGIRHPHAVDDAAAVAAPDAGTGGRGRHLSAAAHRHGNPGHEERPGGAAADACRRAR